MSNLKQIGLGLMQYVQDYDDTYPLYSHGGPPGPSQADGGQWYASDADTWFWQNMIFPYVKSLQVFICPSSPNAGTTYKAGSNPNYGPYSRHYGANTNVMPSSSSTPRKMAAVQSPASTYLFMDSSFYVISYGYADSAPTSTNYYLPGICSFYPPASGTYPSDCEEGRHFDGNNVGFADGHVKWLKTATLVAEALKSDHGDWVYTN